MPKFRPSATALRALALAACLGPLAACDDAETPGQALDEAIENTGDAMKRAGENVKDVAR